jgi:hypothetical protein
LRALRANKRAAPFDEPRKLAPGSRFRSRWAQVCC